MDIVTVDALGRVLLPKNLRVRLGMGPGCQLLAVPLGERLLLQSFDPEAVARQMAKELAGVDVDRIVKDVKSEVEAEARRDITAILAGRKRVRGRNPTPAPGHTVPPAPSRHRRKA